MSQNFYVQVIYGQIHFSVAGALQISKISPTIVGNTALKKYLVKTLKKDKALGSL